MKWIECPTLDFSLVPMREGGASLHYFRQWVVIRPWREWPSAHSAAVLTVRLDMVLGSAQTGQPSHYGQVFSKSHPLQNMGF